MQLRYAYNRLIPLCQLVGDVGGPGARVLQDVHGQVLERGVAAFVEAEQVGNEAHDLRLEVDKEILNKHYSAGGRDGRSCLIKGR